MKKPFILLFCFLMALSGNALFDETNDVQKIITNMDLARTYLKIDFLTAVIFFRDTPRTRALEPVFIEFAELKKDYYRFVAVDCDAVDQDTTQQVSAACKEEFREALPQVLFLEPAPQRIDPETNRTAEPKQHRYEGQANTEDFIDFAKKIMPDFSKRLTTVEDLESFLAEQPTLSKVIYISNKKSAPQYWKALTSRFRGELNFAEVLSKGTKIYEHFDVHKFPTVILFTYKDGDLIEATYNGELAYKTLEKYLNKNAIVRKPPTTPKTEEKNIPPPPVEQKPHAKDLTTENFEETVYATEGLVLVHLFKGKENHKTYNEVLAKFNTVIDIYNLDCSDPRAEKFSEAVLGVKTFPAYRLYPIGLKDKKSKSKIIFSKNKKFKDIGRDISDLIDDSLVALTPNTFPSYLQSIVKTRKPTLFLFHNQDDISMSLRILAQLDRYRNNIQFAHFKNPPEDIKSQFSIEKFPKIAVVFIRDLERKDITLDSGIQTAAYTGRFTYNELRHYLDTFLPAHARSSMLSKTIPQVDNTNDFKTSCQNNANGCVIGLIDGFTGNDNAEFRLKNELLRLENAKKKHSSRTVPFVWVDASCHPEFLKPLDINDEQLPALIYYDAAKKETSQLSGTFEVEEINSFLDDLEKGETTRTPVKGFPKFDLRVCGIHHQQRDPTTLSKLSPTPKNEWRNITNDEFMSQAKVTSREEL